MKCERCGKERKCECVDIFGSTYDLCNCCILVFWQRFKKFLAGS